MRSYVIKSAVFVEILLLLAFTHVVTSFAQKSEQLGFEVDQPRVITAKVLSVDQARRLLRLSVPQGGVLDVTLKAEARDDLEAIERGDTIRVTYYEMVAVYIHAPDAEPNGYSGAFPTSREMGDAPDLLRFSEETLEETAYIININRKFRKITLRLDDGRVKTVSVDPSVASFDELKPGMLVYASLRKAVAVSIFSLERDD